MITDPLLHAPPYARDKMASPSVMDSCNLHQNGYNIGSVIVPLGTKVKGSFHLREGTYAISNLIEEIKFKFILEDEYKTEEQTVFPVDQRHGSLA